MKKVIIISIVLMLCFTAIPLFAVDLNLGAATWYSWWEIEDEEGGPDIDPTILAGPVVSLGLADRWNVSVVFLYGQFEMEGGGEDGGTDEINRVDSDISLNYAISNYFKVFSGIKAMGYYFSGGVHHSIGPALGVGLTLPIVGNLYLLGNLSGMYNYGVHDDTNDDNRPKSNLVEYGFNSTLSLAYYIEQASTTISLGGRYQFFRDKYESDYRPDMDFTFYGVTLSLIYSF